MRKAIPAKCLIDTYTRQGVSWVMIIRLTTKQNAVLRGRCGGLTFREIADTMGLSTETIRSYVKLLHNRFGAINAVQLLLRSAHREIVIDDTRSGRHKQIPYPQMVARMAVKRAIENGIIERLSCEECGDAKSQAHHDDYDKPLDVRWLCVRHHAALHPKVRRKTTALGSGPSRSILAVLRSDARVVEPMSAKPSRIVNTLALAGCR